MIVLIARRELYASLLGKSQTVFDRLRVGDIMARATDDVSQLSDMIVPGSILIRTIGATSRARGRRCMASRAT